MAAAKEIIADAAIAGVLSQLDGIVTFYLTLIPPSSVAR